MATSTWASRELPILEAIAGAEAQGGAPDLNGVTDLTGLPRMTVEGGLRALVDARMITGMDVSTFGGYGLMDIRLREKGRRAVGQWPSGDTYETLLALISARESEVDSEERGKLHALASSLRDIGKGAASELLAAFVKQATGMQ